MPLNKPFWSLLLIYLLTQSQVSAQNIPQAQELTNLNNWCSADAAFSTAPLKDELMVGKDMTIPRVEGKWFSFIATTATIEVHLESGKEKGSLEFPFIFLFDEEVKPIQVKSNIDSDGTLALLNQELTVGKRYYLGISCINPNKKVNYSGSFSVCVSDQASNDFPEGATLLSNLAKWNSELDAYTTDGATGVGKKPSPMSKGPNFNRWFKFKARAAEIDIKLIFDKKENGGVQFPCLTLWNESLRQLQSELDLNAEGALPLSYTRLVVGQTYYISVDHTYNLKYLGTFGLFIDDGLPPKEDNETIQVIGRLQTLSGSGIKQSKVVLLNDKSEIVETQTTDVLGKFAFQKLPSDNHFLVQIEEPDVVFYFDVFQTEEDGTILQKGKEIEKNLYGFQKFPNRLGFLPLLRWTDIEKLKHDNGEFGIVGRLVNANSPVEGVGKRKIYLYRDRKSLVDSTITDDFGKFWFQRASATGKNLISIDGELQDVYAEMLLVSDKNLPVMVSTSKNVDKLGFFHFKSLPPIDVSLTPMEERDEVSDSPDFGRLIAGKTIELRDVYFEHGADQLLPDSYPELDQLVTVLKGNASLKIALHGHTDNTGTEPENQRLSTARAKAVYEYLLKKGIQASRLSFEGHGSSQPVTSNETADGRKANRRVEFKVLP